MSKNYGVKVKLRHWFGEKDDRRIVETILRNVTEIHYNYPCLYNKQHFTAFEIKKTLDGGRVAFESDIQRHGLTVEIKDIVEFETELETKKESD